MELEQIIRKKIEELQKEIKFRDTNEEWLNAKRVKKGFSDVFADTNKYFWEHCQEGGVYIGRLQALKQVLDIIKNH